MTAICYLAAALLAGAAIVIDRPAVCAALVLGAVALALIGAGESERRQLLREARRRRAGRRGFIL